MKLTYYVDWSGYIIKAITDDGGEYVITAGNNVLESAGYVAKSHPKAVSVKTLREWCKQTMHDEFPGIKAKRDTSLMIDLVIASKA